MGKSLRRLQHLERRKKVLGNLFSYCCTTCTGSSMHTKHRVCMALAKPRFTCPFLPYQGSDRGPAWNTWDTLPGSAGRGSHPHFQRNDTDVSAGAKGNSGEKDLGTFPRSSRKREYLQPPATSSHFQLYNFHQSSFGERISETSLNDKPTYICSACHLLYGLCYSATLRSHV